MISETNRVQVLQVTEEIPGAHQQFVDYPLLPEDIVRKDADGTWTKVAPGLQVSGFVLSDEQVQRLKAVWMITEHMIFDILGDVDPDELSEEIKAIKLGGGGGFGYDF